MDQKSPEIVVRFVMDLKPTQQQAKDGEQPTGLRQEEQRDEWLQPVVIFRPRSHRKVSQHIRVRMADVEKDGRPDDQAERAPF